MNFPKPFRGRGRSSSLGREPAASTWRLPGDRSVTRAGSLVHDMQWRMMDDHPTLGIIDWDWPVKVGGVEVGRLSDVDNLPLVHVFQTAVALRWLYRTVEDGKPWNAARAATAATACRAFAAWLVGQGIRTPEAITEDDFLAWLELVRVTKSGKEATLRHQRVLGDPALLVHRMRNRLGRRLGFNPSSPHISAHITGQDEGNPIALIPKPILDYVIGTSIKYVQVYSKDIFAARSYLDELGAEWERVHRKVRPPYKRGNREYQAFDNWIGRRFGFKNESARKAMGSRAPWNDDGRFLSACEGGPPWLDHIRTRHHLQELENSLRTACFILIAFLMGGRSIEVTLLDANCARSVSGGANRPTNHFIVGKVTKHQGRAGKEVTWGVQQLAVEAVGVLSRLCASWRARTGSKRLFVTQTGARLLNSYLCVDLRKFVERIGAPYLDGKPFPLSSHMLRVALAQWLGAEPYGEIAGAFHLKQLSTAAFRGYLRDDPQFRSLLDSFEIQAGEDHLSILLQEPRPQGKFGERVMRDRSPERQAELEANVRAIDLAHVGREAPSTHILRKRNKRGTPVYFTPYSMCVFKADTAECLKGMSEIERSRPVPHLCSPLTCANSALTRLQVPAYLDDMDAYVELRDDRASSPSQQALSRQEIAVLWSVVQPHIATLRAEHALLGEELKDVTDNEAVTLARRARRDAVGAILVRLDSGRYGEVCNGP